jgi:hypothetical protein
MPSSTLGKVALAAGLAVVGGLVAITKLGKKYDNEPRQPSDYSERHHTAPPAPKAADKSSTETTDDGKVTDAPSTSAKPDAQA